jgi:DNA-binding transcriptional ArsR family regulator
MLVIARLLELGWSEGQLRWDPEWRVPKTPHDSAKRIRIVEQLDLEGEMCVQALADALGATQQNVSRHLALLYDDRIVERRHEGRQVWYRLADRSALSLLDDVGAQVAAELRTLADGDGPRVLNQRPR